MSVATFVAGSFLALAVYKIVNLVRYISQAKTTGLPYVLTPVLETEVVGFLLTPLLRYIYHDYLNQGKGWPKWCRFIVKDWQWEDKRLVHEELGDVFLCVSPEGIICYSADAGMGWDVLNRRYDFTKPRDKYKLLEPYGPNVATAEGKTYRFHARITAPPFGDGSGANRLVWNETQSQTKLLLDEWKQEKEARKLQMDVNSLTLAVISLAGFGKRVQWIGEKATEQNIPAGYHMSFLKAINDTTSNMISILLFPGWFMKATPLRSVYQAYSQLDRYMREMIRIEKKRTEEDQDHESLNARGNLLTAVMKVNASEARGTKESGKGRKETFTENEVMGNLFIYLLAGYETTANAIMYGLIILALRPEIQDKVIEEIDRTFEEAQSQGRAEVSYDEDFEKLVYTYGFMYESFRLFPGVTLITKVALQKQQVTLDNGHSYILPPGCRVYLSAPGVHYNERYWPDPYKLDPMRWTTTPNESVFTKKDAKGVDKKVVAADKNRQMRGTLLTFSDGSRACLGRKFAQAEYMAFFVTLLRDYKVRLPPGQNPQIVERDLFLKCAGKVTLAPLDHVTSLCLERRVR